MYYTFEANMNMYAYQYKTQKPNTHKLILCELGKMWVYLFVFVLFVYVWFVFVFLFVLLSLIILFCICFCLCFCFAFMKLYYTNI